MENITHEHITAVILAAGQSTRMGMVQSKNLLMIGNDTVLGHTLSAFENSASIASVVVVTREDDLDEVKASASRFSKVVKIVIGGKSRAESASLGFSVIPDECTFVAIHDGARCLVTPENIDSVVRAAIKHGAATAGSAVYDTVKRLGDDGFVCDTVPREKLFLAATPQIFRRELYREALDNARQIDLFTDDNSLVEALKFNIIPIDTGRNNIKITTAEDALFAKFILNLREQSQKTAIDSFALQGGIK